MIATTLIATLISSMATTVQVEQRYAQELGAAMSSRDLESVRKEHEMFRLKRKTCSIQLTGLMIPSDCYVWLELAVRWQIISAKEKISRVQELDQICRKAAKINLAEKREELKTGDSNLSSECRRSVDKANQILRYRMSENFSTEVGAEIENIPLR